jgi:archaeal flagellin FlaB
MVLVAAVAAAVLINTTGTLQQRAQSTGKEATQEVSSNLKVLNVYGGRGAAADIDNIKMFVELSAGATPMDLEQLIIRYSDGTNTPTNYESEEYDGVAPAAGTPSDDLHFQAQWIRGDGDGTEGNSVMKAGDLVQLHFTLANLIAVRTPVEVQLLPESGSPVSADFKTPSTYGDDTSITLR